MPPAHLKTRLNESLELSPKRLCGAAGSVWQFHGVQC